MRKFVGAVVALCLVTGAARAQAGSDSEEIVVTGQRLEEVVRSFVEEVTAPEMAEDQLARWNSRYCPMVTGIRARQAQYLIDRMSERALEMGLRPGEPNCRANVLILFTQDADGVAQSLAEERAFMAFYNNSENGNSLGRAALREFAASDAPVRWWHVAQTVTRDGDALSGGGETVRAHASRLQRNTRQDFSRVVVVVDNQQLAGIQLASLADYLAMATLAQLDSNADTSQFLTILNLFAQREAGAPMTMAMTDWDRAYLTGLYEAPRNAQDADSQRRAISRTIEERLRE